MSTDGYRRQHGLTLIELLLFIVIVSVGIAGILAVLNLTARTSADPVAPKQALSIAEALLEEVQLAPFTYCDPDDANAASATSSAGCASAGLREDVVPLGLESGDARPFDNVSDYNGYTMTGITDLATGTPIAGLEAYSAAVAVTPAVLGSVAAGDAVLIRVTVTGPGNTQVVLDGYRARYAPNAVP
jgi:MSHA pilin protein MshD